MKIGVLLGVDFVEPKIDKRVFLIAKALKNAGHEPVSYTHLTLPTTPYV